MIEIRVDTRAALRQLDDVQRKQLPFALSVALNDTGKDMVAALSKATSVFDRPRPVTVRGINIKRSNKRDLTTVVSLKRREDNAAPVNEYLQAEVQGGRRPTKRSELLLQRAGILPPGKQTRPGSGARLDGYGNMSRGQIVQIISYFRAFGGVATSGRARGRAGTQTASQLLNRNVAKPRKPVEYFVVPDGAPGVAAGVWQRIGKTIKPILIFIDPPTYRPVYKFEPVAEAVATARFNPNLERAMRAALASAR